MSGLPSRTPPRTLQLTESLDLHCRLVQHNSTESSIPRTSGHKVGILRCIHCTHMLRHEFGVESLGADIQWIVTPLIPSHTAPPFVCSGSVRTRLAADRMLYIGTETSSHIPSSSGPVFFAKLHEHQRRARRIEVCSCNVAIRDVPACFALFFLAFPVAAVLTMYLSIVMGRVDEKRSG